MSLPPAVVAAMLARAAVVVPTPTAPAQKLVERCLLPAEVKEGLSFGELEARLKSSWEDWARDAQVEPEVCPEVLASTLAASAEDLEAQEEDDDDVACLSLAAPEALPEFLASMASSPPVSSSPSDAALSSSTSASFAVQRLSKRPPQVLRKEGLFCPDCSAREACPFHNEPQPHANEDLQYLPGTSTVGLLLPHKAAGVGVIGPSSTSHRTEDNTEDTSTEAGSSSEPCFCGSDGWSDVGEASSATRQEGWPAQAPGFCREDTWLPQLLPVETAVAGACYGAGAPGTAGGVLRPHGHGSAPAAGMRSRSAGGSGTVVATSLGLDGSWSASCAAGIAAVSGAGQQQLDSKALSRAADGLAGGAGNCRGTVRTR